MDILKVLATKNNAFGETVVSSIFNYLLDPQADHGFGSTFLVRYLKTLVEQLPFLDNELLKRLEAYQLDGDPNVRVWAEWSSADSEQKGRRIDSVLQVSYGKKVFLIATEMKIYARSSSDETQLDAYVKMLIEARKSLLDPEDGVQPHGPSDIECALVYVIPGNSEKGLEYAKKASDTCTANGINGVIVVPWAASSLVDGYSGLRVSTPLERILLKLLEQNYLGEASPADQGALEIVRSLRNAALKNFAYKYLTSSTTVRQFPDDDTYRHGLEENQLALLECFKEAVRKTLSSKKLTANPLHTSIGVPIIEHPKDGENNTLCRILTVDSYETGAPLDQFVVQLSKKYYEGQIERVRMVIKEYPVHGNIIEEREDGEQLFHENGKRNEPVFRIIFDPDPVEMKRDEITASFVTLITALKRAIKNDNSNIIR